MTIGEIERLLLDRFPMAFAEKWDRVGLSAGDSSAACTGVLCALDPTPSLVRQARSRGANLLFTHHPVFLDAPRRFTPEPSTSTLGAATLWEAVRSGVSLIALHTNLDRSEEALRFFASKLDLAYLGRATSEGYGALVDGGSMTLGELSRRVGGALGADPVLWSNTAGAKAYERPAGTVAYLSGALGSLGEDALATGAQTIVCGEAGYHRLIELINKKSLKNDNVAVLVVGHDASERPYGELLAKVIRTIAPDVDVDVASEPFAWQREASQEA